MLNVKFASTLLVAVLSLPAAHALDYPDSPRGDVVDNYHGTPVADPYRWLEDVDSAETKAWVQAQNAVTFDVLKALPKRAAFKDRLTELWNYERFSIPTKRAGRTFYTRNDGLQNQNVLYVQDAKGQPRVLLDPNALSDDGTVALASSSVSPDGQWLAYALSDGGSDWRRIRVRNVGTGADLPETLTRSKFTSLEWTKDSGGFFYSRYPQQTSSGDDTFDDLANQALYYHRIDSEQKDDVRVHARPDHPKWGFGATVTDNGQHLVISTWKGADSRNQLYLLDLQDPAKPRFDGVIKPLVEGFDARYDVIGAPTGRLFIYTTENAERGKIVAVDLQRPARGLWGTVVPQSESTIRTADFVGGKIVTVTMQDAANHIQVYKANGLPDRKIPLPGLGSVRAISGEPHRPELFFRFESYLTPPANYRANLDSGAVADFQRADVDFPFAEYTTVQRFYASRDGTRVPMFVTHRKGMKLDGSHPTLLYGYGGFNISLTPRFRPARLAWLDAGGVFAVANLRGGGEYGEAWHKAGTRERKQNVFDDFIAAAEFLVDEGYTAPEHLGIQGGSNGGLLVGAVSNQRPDLFAAALPAVGVMDMLRFHKFTIGWAWVPDYGSADEPEGFAYLYPYSPLHNLEQGTDYPATLVTTADHDDRVVPGHSFKYTAALQRAHAGDDPVLIRIETRAGHGAGKPTSKRIEEAADQYAFLWEYTR